MSETNPTLIDLLDYMKTTMEKDGYEVFDYSYDNHASYSQHGDYVSSEDFFDAFFKKLLDKHK